MSWRNIVYLLSVAYVLVMIGLVPVLYLLGYNESSILESLGAGIFWGLPLVIIFLISKSSNDNQVFRFFKWAAIISTGLIWLPTALCEVASCGASAMVIGIIGIPALPVLIISFIVLVILKIRNLVKK